MPKGVFDVIGPIMVGPSSSHTAGAARIGYVARQLSGGDFISAVCTLHGSFAKTYLGHGTDIAIAAGLLGFSEDDERLRDAFSIAKKLNKEICFQEEDLGDVHENTVKIDTITITGKHSMVASSIGGGNISVVSIDGFETSFDADAPTLVVMHYDRPGVVSNITGLLAKEDINIATMQLSRKSRGDIASMVVVCDSLIQKKLLDKVLENKEVVSAIVYHPNGQESCDV